MKSRKTLNESNLLKTTQFFQNMNKNSKLKNNSNISNENSEKSSSKLSNSKNQSKNGYAQFFRSITNQVKGAISQDEKSEIGKEDSFEKIINDGKGSLIEMIQNANIDQKLLSLIDDTRELFNDKGLVTPITNEKEKYELIEKSQYEKLKKDKEDLKSEAIRKKEELNQLNLNFYKTKNELSNLTVNLNKQDKLKNDCVNKIYKLQDSLKDLTLNNYKLMDSVNKEKVEKDNIFRSLVYFQNKNNSKLPTELKEIYNKFNNAQFIKSHNVNKLDNIETLKSRIENLELMLRERNQEILLKKEIIRDAIERKLVQE